MILVPHVEGFVGVEMTWWASFVQHCLYECGGRITESSYSQRLAVGSQLVAYRMGYETLAVHDDSFHEFRFNLSPEDLVWIAKGNIRYVRTR